MNQIEAFKATLEVAKNRFYDDLYLETPGTDYEHLESMLSRLDEETMSEAKIGRWLGYAQGVLVANGILTLEECKEINMKHA